MRCTSRARSGRPESTAGAELDEQARILEGRGADVIMLETFYNLDELELAVESVRSVTKLPIVALMSFDSDAVTLAGVSARAAGERLRQLDLAAFGANHGRGPAAALAALAEMAGDGTVLAALPNVGLATFTGARVAFPHATPEYFAEFAARARGLGAQLIGGCCGTTPCADRGDPRSGRREPRRAGGAAGPRAAARSAASPGREADRAGPAARGPGVRGLGAARPAARRECRGPGRCGAPDQGIRARAVRRRQRQPEGAGPDERVDGVGRHPADRRDRGDPAPDAARLDPVGPRVDAPRRPRGGRAERPRGHRRCARDGRLSGHRLGLRRRCDRPRRADRTAERGHRLPRPRDRRPDVVLPRGGSQSDRRRPRPGGRAVRAQGRGGRPLGDDAGPLRPLVPGGVPGADRRLARAAARRRVADPVARARGPGAQRDTRHRRPRARPGALPRGGDGRRGGGSGTRPRAGGAGARARRGRLRRRAVPPAARRARPARDDPAANSGRSRPAASPVRAPSAPVQPGRRTRPARRSARRRRSPRPGRPRSPPDRPSCRGARGR